jgi:hypothetical protein
MLASNGSSFKNIINSSNCCEKLKERLCVKRIFEPLFTATFYIFTSLLSFRKKTNNFSLSLNNYSLVSYAPSRFLYTIYYRAIYVPIKFNVHWNICGPVFKINYSTIPHEINEWNKASMKNLK